MQVRTFLGGSVIVVLGAFAAQPALASFHFMQIEQVIGGVNGDPTAQAIQLRMRSGGQIFLASSRIRVWDAAGANPVVVINFASSVANGACGTRVLVVSPSFVNQTSPAATPDFPMTSLIPASYLAAGSMTFETNNGSIIYWRLSWGDYTGATTGSTTNDGDGNFGPPWPGSLPSTCARALQFQGVCFAASTTNEDDYALTSGAATFENNLGSSFTVNTVPNACCEDSDCDEGCDPETGKCISKCGSCPTDGPVSGPDGDVGAADLGWVLGNWGPFVDNPLCQDEKGNFVGCPADLVCLDELEPQASNQDVGPEEIAKITGSWGPCPG